MRQSQRRRLRARGRRFAPSSACSRTASQLAISPAGASRDRRTARREAAQRSPLLRRKQARMAAGNLSDLPMQRPAPCGPSGAFSQLGCGGWNHATASAEATAIRRIGRWVRHARSGAPKRVGEARRLRVFARHGQAGGSVAHAAYREHLVPEKLPIGPSRREDLTPLESAARMAKSIRPN
jgi:hypothetical protein